MKGRADQMKRPPLEELVMRYHRQRQLRPAAEAQIAKMEEQRKANMRSWKPEQILAS